MANSKWQMANSKWQMANSKWQMANSKWQMAKSRLSVRWWFGNSRCGGRGLWWDGVVEERFEFGPRDVAVEDILEILLEVTFRLGSVDPNVSGLHAIRPQLLGEPQVVDGLAFAHLGPGTAG